MARYIENWGGKSSEMLCHVGKNSYWRVEGLCLQTAGIIHPVTHIHTPEDLKLNGCYLCKCSTRSEGKLHLLSIALIYATEYIFDLGTDAFKNEIVEMHLLRLSQSHATSLHYRWAYFASRITNKSIFFNV